MKNLDWQNLGFGYRDTNSIRCSYRNGECDERVRS